MIIAEGTIDFENKIKRLSNDLSSGGHEAEVTFQMILEMSGLDDARVDYLLAIAYLNGYGTEQNCAKSAYYYRKAISEGSKASYIELFDTLWRINTPESLKEMVDLALPLAESGNRDMCGRMGRAYRDGRGVPKNLGIAADWMRKAANQNLGWAKNELFDILWRIGTPESYKEMISVATAFAEAGDSGAMGRVGRMYRDGKGVGKDLNKAAEWMRKAADKVHGWKNDLFDILWEIGTPESYKEMISLAKEFAKSGDARISARLGRAYRDGKGVGKDLNKAAEWMRKAADKNVGWAKNELLDILWQIGTPESYSQMKKLAEKFAETGDGEAMGHIGRMYRDGKGVGKDLNKAAEWMQKAADKNIEWAKNEFFDILYIDCRYSSWITMIDYATPLAEKGNPNMQARLGRAYRDGKGVYCDLSIAKEWMEKAAKQNLWWAKNELLEILWRINDSSPDLVNIATKFAKSDNIEAMGYLGRVYRDGFGVNQDLCASADWFLKASKEDRKWERELFAVLVLLNTDESINVLKSLADNNYLAKAFYIHSLGYNEEICTELHECALKVNPGLCSQLEPYYSDDRKCNYLLDSLICRCATEEECKAIYPLMFTVDSNLKLLQEMYTAIIDYLTRICKKLNLDFIASAGTALGAVRHQGFIPWDDDVDMYMFESEIFKLSDYLKSINSILYINKFTLYGNFYKVGSRKFKLSLDIFPMLSCIRDNLGKKTFLNYPVKSKDGSIEYCFPRDCHPGILGLNIKEKDMYPLKIVNFEDIQIALPQNSERYLKYIYGNYNFLPNKLWRHMSNKEIEEYASSWMLNNYYFREEFERIIKLL